MVLEVTSPRLHVTTATSQSLSFFSKLHQLLWSVWCGLVICRDKKAGAHTPTHTHTHNPPRRQLSLSPLYHPPCPLLHSFRVTASLPLPNECVCVCVCVCVCELGRAEW